MSMSQSYAFSKTVENWQKNQYVLATHHGFSICQVTSSLKKMGGDSVTGGDLSEKKHTAKINFQPRSTQKKNTCHFLVPCFETA